MSQVKITPWDRDDTVDIDEVYTKLSWLRDERKPSGKTQRELDDYTEIFEGHKRFAKPKRMLVYGRPGIGKSTFSQKLSVDWANGKNEILKKFDLLLLIKLRDVCGIEDLPSIFKASKLFAADGSISTDSLLEYVRQNQEKVLLVLDGYDEYSAGESSPILEIWEGNQLRDCHVVVTTRQMEGEELIKFSHVQCEIKGFNSKEQVNEFASKFITDQKDVEEFDRYLTKVKLWDIAEIPLLLLMLCLIWNNRGRKELPKSRLQLHERFVETLLCHMSVKDQDNSPLYRIEPINIVDDYREELTSVGKLALDALLRSTLYVDLKDFDRGNGVVTDKMIRSGLLQVSKRSSADPNKSLFFLHKSIQEFLAAWYIMNEAGLKEGKVDCFASIDSFDKAVRLKEILKFMCEWSVEGARAVFSLLGFIGTKDGLTECCFTKTPSLDDLSDNKRRFRNVALNCLLCCSAAVKPVVYPDFLSNVGGVVTVSASNIGRVAAGHFLRSRNLPNYVFFEGGSFRDFLSIVEDLRAFFVTCKGVRLEASTFFLKHADTEETKHFFLKKEGEQFYLFFNRIWYYSPTQMLKALTSSLPETPPQTKMAFTAELGNDEECTHLDLTRNSEGTSNYGWNCFSFVSEVVFTDIRTSEELSVLSDLLSVVAFPQIITVTQRRHRLFDAEVVKKMVSHTKITSNLFKLELNRLNMTAQNAAVIARSLHRASNLHELILSDSPLYGSVSDLAESLRNVPRLSKLTLFRVGMGHQECESLAISLKYLPGLEVLDISYNSLGQGITELARNLTSLPRLSHLNMSRTNMGMQEAASLAQALTNVPNLCYLDLVGNPLCRGASVLVEHLSSVPNLVELNLEHVIMTKKEVDDVSKAQRKIVTTSYHVSCLFLFSIPIGQNLHAIRERFRLTLPR